MSHSIDEHLSKFGDLDFSIYITFDKQDRETDRKLVLDNHAQRKNTSEGDSLISEQCVMFKTTIENGKHFCDPNDKVKSDRCLRHSMRATRA